MWNVWLVMTPAEVFVFDFGWGDLQDHWQDCEDCNGTGLDEPDDCSICDGAGRTRWGSFYEQDVGLCERCKRADVRIAEMYSGDVGWVCLPCYVDDHEEACGCALWREAEDARCTSHATSTKEKR